jgi:proton-coupled amino acid transporter
MKGFVASAVLYLPKSFVNGGYGFSIIVLIASAIITIYCSLLLLQVRKITKSSSYSELGLKLYGRVGKGLVDVSLCLSQIGFVSAYVYFIMVNYNAILTEAFKVDIDRNYFAIFCIFLFAALCFVRKIEVFAITHVFADLMIVLALVVIVWYGIINLDEKGRNTGVPFINTKTYTDAIGFSVYAFEGIGMILPIQDITKNQE